jgi:hypothetical protein
VSIDFHVFPSPPNIFVDIAQNIVRFIVEYDGGGTIIKKKFDKIQDKLLTKDES